MNVPHFAWIWLCAAWLLGSAAPAQGAEDVQVPYASLYRALEPGLTIAKFDRLIAKQRISSRRPGVAPGQIQVQILARAGVIMIPVGPFGAVSFPMTQALLSENPQVQSNQPKGSLSVSATMEVKLDGGTQLAYSELFAAATQAQEALAALGPSMAGRKIRSIEFEFPPNTDARAELSDSKAEEILIANDFGLLSIRVDAALVKRSAQIKFSQPPVAARPHID